MNEGFKFLPDRASVYAGEVDALYFFLIGVTIFFSLLIFVLIYIFAVRYRRRTEDEMPEQIPGLLKLELAWSVIPFLITMVMFVWGAKLYFNVYSPPDEALDIYVVGKQWMWHIQHPTGQREINQLHVPIGQPVKLIMASEDVIHSFYIPALRIKKDVVPGRYTTMWFEANKTGEYHLFCAEYCGTKHAQMIGQVIIMEPVAYQQWLSGDAADGSIAEIGEKKFLQLGCQTCHAEKPDARGPSLHGLFGEPVKLSNGETVIADEGYIRESILQPKTKITSGYKTIMPTYQGQISEKVVLQITAYIKSLRKEKE